MLDVKEAQMYNRIPHFNPKAAPLFCVNVIPDLLKHHIITEEEFRKNHPMGASSEVHIAYCKRVGWFKPGSPYMRLTAWLDYRRQFLPRFD